MAEQYYTVPENPQYDDKTIRRLQNGDPANADAVFNPIFEALIRNTAAVKNRIINPNLIINWDFTNPVNRQGQTEYIKKGYTIDRWHSAYAVPVNLKSNGIELTTPDKSSVAFLTTVDSPERLVGREVTFSVFITENNTIDKVQCAIYYGKTSTNQTFSSGINFTVAGGQTGVFSMTKVLPDMDSYLCMNPTIRILNPTSEGSFVVAAVKLELGPVQTLAHQENGNWVLNEIQDYAEQYAICSQYDLTTGKFVGSQHSNQNLLVNSYFVGGGSQKGSGIFPINQRGNTGHQEVESMSYFFDKWLGGSGASLSLLEDGLHMSWLSSNYAFLGQRVPPEVFRAIQGRTVTISALVKGNGTAVVGLPNNANNITRLNINSDENVLISKTLVFPSSGTHETLTNMISLFIESGELTYIAAKLELGSVQTLAHKEEDKWVLNEIPDYELELLKCQRYQRAYYRPDDATSIFMGCAGNTSYVSFIMPFSINKTPAKPDLSKLILYDVNSNTKLDITNAEFFGNGRTSLVLIVYAAGITTGHIYTIGVNKGEYLIIDAND